MRNGEERASGRKTASFPMATATSATSWGMTSWAGQRGKPGSGGGSPYLPPGLIVLPPRARFEERGDWRILPDRQLAT